MNSALLALIGGIAVVVAAVGFTVFGKPKPESSQSLPTTSEVSRSATAPPPPATQSAAELYARSAPTDAPISPTERARLATVANGSTAATATAANVPVITAPMNANKPAQTAMRPHTFVPLQDPKRPSTPELEDLSQKILAWGESHQLVNVSQILVNTDHSDPLIRTYVAVALGKIAISHPPAELGSVIAALGKLSQDKHPAVRNAAIKALSSIQSVTVLPYLEKSLGNTGGTTKQTATDAIARLKPLHH